MILRGGKGDSPFASTSLAQLRGGKSLIRPELAHSIVSAAVWQSKEAKYLFYDPSARFPIAVGIDYVALFRCCAGAQRSNRRFDN
jgi:hypothetical protein